MIQSNSNSFDHLFRTQYSKLVSVLTGKFGTRNIDVIEDAVQDALYKAMTLWGYQETPTEPGNWLYKVAYNRVIDILRRNNKSVEYNVNLHQISFSEEHLVNNSIDDDQIMMIFACCHPQLKETEQLMLSLKLLCGFSNKEIARAFNKQPEAVKKAITRAKQKFKTEIGELQFPNENQLHNRLGAVLKVIYLLFNNGYTAAEGENLLNKEICEDAIRLALIIHQIDKYVSAELKALIALMLFNYSRMDARVNDKLELLTLEKQNRAIWNMEAIKKANYYFQYSAYGNVLSKYHLEAAIAREHALAKSYKTTDWKQILEYYELLLRMYPSPIVSLNLIVVFDKINGADLALKKLKKLNPKEYIRNHLYFAIKGDLELKLGYNSFNLSLEKAILLTDNIMEKEFLKRKLLTSFL